MGHSVAQWTNALVLQMPRGIIWNYEPDSDLYKYVKAYAPRLEQAENNADLLLQEMRPESTYQLLGEWEEYLGLPECELEHQSFESRRNAVVEKYHRKSGLQAWNIEKLAGDLGFDIKVHEIFPHHCLRDCTYPLYEERYRHVLDVEVFGITQSYATCLDDCLTPLLLETAAQLECTLEKIKLGGKYYNFIYEQENG